MIYGDLSSVLAHHIPGEFRRPLWGQYDGSEDEAEIWMALTSPVDNPSGMPQPVSVWKVIIQLLYFADDQKNAFHHIH